MAFKFSVEYDARFLDRLDDVLDQFSDITLETMKKAKAQIEPNMRDELRDVPRKRKYPQDYPIEWTSEKQRRAYFATNGFGKGIPYRRTGTMANSWQFFIAQEGSTSKFVIFNRASYSRYVVGTLAQNDRVAYGQIQRFHSITGWQKAKPTVEFWFSAFLETFEELLSQEVNAIVRQV